MNTTTTEVSGYWVSAGTGYELQAELPAGFRGSRRSDLFRAIPPVEVVCKPYGIETKKGITGIAVGISREALLVRFPDDTMRYGDRPAQWMDVNFDQTSHGRRFVRTIGAAMKLLGRLAREGSRKRATAAKLAERAAGRVGREFTCQICEGRQIVRKGLLVLHGYERPGHGSIVGDCYGVNRKSWEVECDALVEWIGHLVASKLGLVRALEQLPNATELHELRGYPAKLVTVARGAAGFAHLLSCKLSETRSQIEGLTREIDRQRARLASWKPAA